MPILQADRDSLLAVAPLPVSLSVAIPPILSNVLLESKDGQTKTFKTTWKSKSLSPQSRQISALRPMLKKIPRPARSAGQCWCPWDEAAHEKRTKTQGAFQFVWLNLVKQFQI